MHFTHPTGGTVYRGALAGATVSLLTMSCAGADKKQESVTKKPNVLFLIVDDLRPELRCYGSPTVKSPNIDRLAREGVLFRRAYCQMAISMATRASLWTGFLTTRNLIYTNRSVDALMPDAVTIPGYFRERGYQVSGIGKLFHYPEDNRRQFGDGWFENKPGTRERGRGYVTPEAISQIVREKGPAWEMADVNDNEYRDGYYAEWASGRLAELKQDGKPFFLGIGFHKPHLPFCAPKKYWDLYSGQEIRLADNPFYPENGSPHGYNNSTELRTYRNMPDGDTLISEATAQTLIHAYYACVSYVDAQIGSVLDALDSLGLARNTVVVLVGDHGWKLGEHGMWGKHTNFEEDTHATMVIRAPGMTNGREAGSFVEFIDIFPTLCTQCGLPVPGNLDGTDLTPVLRNPSAIVRDEAFSLWPSGRIDNDDSRRVILGYSLRTADYRYTEWRQPASGRVVDRELYDHRSDPGENINAANQTRNRKTVSRLSGRLEKILSAHPGSN
jgi:arylsulfatase A-like enzyme